MFMGQKKTVKKKWKNAETEKKIPRKENQQWLYSKGKVLCKTSTKHDIDDSCILKHHIEIILC